MEGLLEAGVLPDLLACSCSKRCDTVYACQMDSSVLIDQVLKLITWHQVSTMMTEKKLDSIRQTFNSALMQLTETKPYPVNNEDLKILITLLHTHFHFVVVSFLS